MPAMLREMFLGKLHRGAVTECCLDYPGSITIDEELLDAAGILVHQRVQVLNINTGARFETYTIPGPRGSRQMIINGAAARLAQRGDRVIVIAYGLCDEAECKALRPKVVQLDEQNRIAGILR